MTNLPLRAALAGLLAFTLVASAGCRRHRRADATLPAAAEIVDEETEIEVPLEGGEVARVKATLTFADDGKTRPVVLIPPGGGNISRRGTRAGDGHRDYPRAVDTTRDLAGVLAARGFLVLAWDKRTCGPKDRPECARYPTADVDAEGPVALARDVDAACALAETHPLSNGAVAMWAHGQAAQIALRSSCADHAKAMVLVAPVPRSVDQVLVASMKHRAVEVSARAKREKGEEKAKSELEARELTNKAASFEETFRAIKAGKFPNDARLFGATIPFWRAWMKLTDEVPGRNPSPKQPWLVAVGEHDVQFAPRDRKLILDWGKRANIDAVVVKGVDHHLLREGALDATAIEPMLEWLDKTLAVDGES